MLLTYSEYSKSGFGRDIPADRYAEAAALQINYILEKGGPNAAPLRSVLAHGYDEHYTARGALDARYSPDSYAVLREKFGLCKWI